MLVSGYEFHKLCKFSFCPRYPVNVSFNKMEYGDNVFLNLDHFDQFIGILAQYPKLKRFNLITHNSDRTFTKEHFEKIQKYVVRVYCINCNINACNKITKIPLGFVDDKYKPHSQLIDVMNSMEEKNILCYMNFTIKTNPIERTKCFDFFKDKQYITSEQNIPPKDFYMQIRRSKYVLSPDGTGYDCHRVYESMLFDTIPIILSNPLSDFYFNLPVLIVKSWDEVTEEMLNNKYEELYKKLVNWKKDNPKWSTAKYWL
jgi:hypothetical protein